MSRSRSQAGALRRKAAQPIVAILIFGISAGLLSGCGARQPVGTASGPRPGSGDSGAAEEQGVLALADLENAQEAIRRGDRIPAANDLRQARLHARQLLTTPSPVFGGGSGGSPAQNAFRLLTSIDTAVTALQTGDLDAAAARVNQIISSAERARSPNTLPLVRVQESLALARLAAATGRRDDVRSQLATAEEALRQFRPPGAMVAERNDVVAAIDDQRSREGEGTGATPPELALLSGRVASLTNAR